ncbi:MAG: Alanine racemase [Thermoanaerobacterales bacterium 50_218]|nr:MAG: Alanine racemase [Thermoanaerobacterales bacterium 50_218]HAA89179.1 alanine racemase [Peptococcaceae bacterium]
MSDYQSSKTRWVRINLGAIAHNVAQVSRVLRPGVKLLAVVKADGYGHGALQVARVALAHGASMLGVTHPEEGIKLRESGITAPILVFRPLLPGEEEVALEYRLTPSLSSFEQAKLLAEAARRRGIRVAVHWKIETGMGRTGFTPASFKDCLDQLLALPGLIWEGIYTHFAAAAGDREFTYHQFHQFVELLESLESKGIKFPIRHVCNSAATLLYPEMHLDMVRVGTLLYGQLPAGIKDSPVTLRETWSFWTRIIHLQRASRGSTIGYGRTYRIPRDTVLAILPVGYHDGFGVDVFPRPAGLIDLAKILAKIAGSYFGLPWGSFYVQVNGRYAPVVGRVGMELTCVDVGTIPDVSVGTPVLLPSRRTVLSETIPRVYEESQVVTDIPEKDEKIF